MRTYVKNLAYTITVLVFAALSLSSCGEFSRSLTSYPSYNRGDLVSVDSIIVYPQQFNSNRITSNNYNAYVSANNTVTQYNIVYKSVDTDITLSLFKSAAIFVPSKNVSANIILYCRHDSVVNTDAPSLASVSNINGDSFDGFSNNEAAFAAYMASHGYIVIMPDYIGFGETVSRFHPYLQADSLAATNIDAILALEALASSNYSDFSLGNKLFITGYGEGGYAALATHKEIEEGSYEVPDLTAVIAGAAPADLSGSMSEQWLSTDNQTNPAQLANLFLSYQDNYHLYDNTVAYIKPDYSDFPNLFNGVNDFSDINEDIPSAPIDLFLDNIEVDLNTDYAAVQSDYNATPGNEFFFYIKDNDLHRYDPGRTPVAFIHFENDDTIPYDNSSDTAAYMVANHSRTMAADRAGFIAQTGDVLLLDPSGGSDSDHNDGLNDYLETMIELINDISEAW